jgi:hypothetical protein
MEQVRVGAVEGERGVDGGDAGRGGSEEITRARCCGLRGDVRASVGAIHFSPFLRNWFFRSLLISKSTFLCNDRAFTRSFFTVEISA